MELVEDFKSKYHREEEEEERWQEAEEDREMFSRELLSWITYSSKSIFIFFSFSLIIGYMRTYYQIGNGDSIGKHKRNIMCTNK